MLQILKKLQNLDAEFSEEGEEDEDEEEDDSDEELREKLATLDLEKTSAAELETLLGPKYMSKFQEMLTTGIPADWIESEQLNVIEPWFLRYHVGIVIDEPVPDYVPPLWTECKLPTLDANVKDCDFWWNDLVELCIIYAFIYSQYDESELADREILTEEVIPVALSLSSVLNSTSPEAFTFASAPEAIESAKSQIFMNCVEVVDFKQDLLPGCQALLSHPLQVQRMLADMARWFYKRRRPDEYFAGKRLLFLLGWFTKECSDLKTASQLLKFLSSVLELDSSEQEGHENEHDE